MKATDIQLEKSVHNATVVEVVEIETICGGDAPHQPVMIKKEYWSKTGQFLGAVAVF